MGAKPESNFPEEPHAPCVNQRHLALAGRDDVFDIEIDAYIHCVSAFVKLAQSEYQLLTEIVPEHHQKKTFDSLIQVSLASACKGCCLSSRTF